MYDKITLNVPTAPLNANTLTIGGRNANGTVSNVTLTAVLSAPAAGQFITDGNLTNTLTNLAVAFNTAMAGKATMTVQHVPDRVEIVPVSTDRASTAFFLGSLTGIGELAGVPAYSHLAGTFSLVNASQTVTGTGGADTIDVFNGSHLSNATIDGGAGTDIIYVVGNETIALAAGTSFTQVEEFRFNPNAATKILDITAIAQLGSLNTIDMGGGQIRIQGAFTGLVDFTGKILNNVSEIARATANSTAIQAPDGYNGKITGGNSADTLLGGSGAETISGGFASDSISGGGGADSLSGGIGNDTITGGPDTDRVDGGLDEDLILISTADWTGPETVIGGNGDDTIQFDGSLLDLGGKTVNTVEHFVGTFASGNRVNLSAAQFLTPLSYTGGAGIDTVGVFSGTADFTGKTLASIEVLELMTANNTLTMPAGVSLIGRNTLGTGVIVAALADVSANTQKFEFQGVGPDILRLTGGGTIDFTGNTSFTGLETVEFAGATPVIMTAHNSVSARYVGSTGADSLNGGLVADTLQGGDGDDTLVAGGGVDKLQGGNNDDVIRFPSGAVDTGEIIDGGAGTLDVLRFDGTSVLLVNNATISNIERIETTANDTTLQISAAQLAGVTEIDMKGSGTFDSLSVTGGTVDLTGITLTGINKITPGSSPATITLPASVATPLLATGSLNNDTFVVTRTALAANQFGFSLNTGTDRVVVTGGGTLDLGTVTTLTDVEEVLFQGAGPYTVSAGNTAARVLLAEGGNDSLTGGSQADTLFGGTGNDTLTGGAQADVLVGEVGNNKLFGNFGNDFLFGGTDADTLDGGEDNDTLVADAQNDRLQGWDGADTLFGGTGADTLEGGNENDVLVGGADADSLVGGQGTDTLFGGSENDILDGSGDTSPDLLLGGDGPDLLIAASNDVMWGGTANDTFRLMSAGTFTIADFVRSDGDRIDLTSLSAAYTGAAAVTLIGTPEVRSNGLIYTFLHGGNTIVLNVVGNPAPTGLIAGDFL